MGASTYQPMDNLCHTLVGIGLAEAGLKRKTALGTATLLVGANLPDVDAAAYHWGRVAGLGFRRGWTHGVLAMAVWPFILAGAMLAWDRWVRRRRKPGAVPADARWLVGLAAIAVMSHPLLDLCNTYGVRLLMPFSGRWFYGDTLFIVDPWVWLALLAGIVGSWILRARGAARPERPARAALAATAAYIVVMAGLNLAARALVKRELAAQGGHVRRFMAAPVPVSPFTRDVIVDLGDAYAVGRLDWRGAPRYTPMLEAVPRNDGDAEVAVAIGTADGRTFLRWARFPAFHVARDTAGAVVLISDMRYPGQAWAQVAIPVGGALSLPASPRTPERP
jgi:inner membrane protein